jgi:mRNA interferase RelE/StbE
MRYFCGEKDHYTATAARALKRHANRAKVIGEKINQYAENPAAQANQVKALAGSDAKRLRVGDYRVIFSETADAILILDLGPRGGIYK